MRFYEPFQRLDLAGFNPRENAIYVKSTIAVLIPEKSTLLGKDPTINDGEVGAASIDFYHQLDENATSQNMFEQVRLVKVLENVLSEKELGLSGAKLTQRLAEKVKWIFDGRPMEYKVTARVYNANSVVGGQVTTTIAQQGNIAIV